MYKELFIAFIVSIDIYLTAAVYCNSGIKIPLPSAAIIASVGSAVLTVSMVFSGFLKHFIPPSDFHCCGIVVLTVIGVFTIFKSIIRNFIEHLSKKESISMKTEKGSLVLRLYLDDTAADIDDSKTLSAVEAFSIAIISSLDCAATGIGVGCANINVPLAAGATLICGFSAMLLGNLTGKKLSSLNHDFSWIGGTLLIVFAFLV